MTYQLTVDLSIPMIGMLKRKGERVIIDTALKGLKQRVEALPSADAVVSLGVALKGLMEPPASLGKEPPGDDGLAADDMTED